MNKRYVVKLTSQERAELEAVLRSLVAGWKAQRAHALLALDQVKADPR